MKKLLLVLVFVLSFGSLAQAEVVKFSQFSLDVPTGYTYLENADGVFVTNKDETAMASITFFDAADGEPDLYAAAFAEEFGSKDVQKVPTDDAQTFGYTFIFQDPDFGSSLGIITIENKVGVLIMILGKDMALLDMTTTIE